MGVEQRDLGLSGGLAGAARFAGGSSKFSFPISDNRTDLANSCYCCLHHDSHETLSAVELLDWSPLQPSPLG